MTKYSKIIISSAFVLLLSACNDFLDRTPYDQISSGNVFTNASLAETVVIGAYSNIKADYIDNSGSTLNWDAFASVLDPHPDFLNSNYLYLKGIILPNNSSFESYWKRFYEGINRANDVINNISKVPEMSAALKAQRIAECKFLRAYHYYRLNCLWRGVPIYLENLAPSEYTYPRSSEDAVWQVIIDDLTDCINTNELPAKYTSNDSNFGRITKGAAYTLRGKTYLWLKEYSKAEADFREVGKLGYKLYEGSYADLFKEANEKCDEMIFSVQMEDVSDQGNVFSRTYGNKTTTGNGNSSFYINTNFANSYEWANGKSFDWNDVIDGYNNMSEKARSVYFLRNGLTSAERNLMQTYGADLSEYIDGGNEERIRNAYIGRDPRMEATIITPYAKYRGGFSGEEVTYTARFPYRSTATPYFDMQTNSDQNYLYSIRKFVTEGRQYLNVLQNPVDVPIFRYADVLLGLAEALNEQGQYAEAIIEVNKVRKRAGVAPLNDASNMGKTITSSDELRPRIRNEKKWELACEMVLYYDELRWGTWKDSKFDSGNGLLEIWGSPINTYSWGGAAYLKWPIPSSEREKNPSLVQNDGWY